MVGALALGLAFTGPPGIISGGKAASRPAAAASQVVSLARSAMPAGKVRHVLIISEDGMRPDLITQQPMPWHERLAKEGSYSWHARTIRTSDTLPSHASMLSGVDVNLHGLTWNSWRPARGFIQVPTIFKEAGEHGLKTAAFVGKFKLRHILPAGTVGIFERPGYYCKKVSDEASRYLEREKPDLAFVHFSDPDEAGHSRGWLSEPYRKAAAAADRCLGTLYQALERAGTLDETLIIVSADHGGHNHSHNGGLASDREIAWIARGPRVRQHYAIRGRISTMDTAATALSVLGLPPGRLVGKPVTEIFQ
jgi:predicted AlkP superfamily pyrophosphatase or phosphodiesterase